MSIYARSGRLGLVGLNGSNVHIGKHQNPWGQSSRHRRLNVQTPTSNARSPFRRKTVSPFDPNRGRDAGYPAPPAQIRAGALTHTAPASGQTSAALSATLPSRTPAWPSSRLCHAIPGTASGTCFGPLTSRWPRSFAPSTPPGLSSPCSPTSQLSGRRRRPAGLASVRRSNGSYGFPVSRFHKGVSSKVQGRNQRVPPVSGPSSLPPD